MEQCSKTQYALWPLEAVPGCDQAAQGCHEEIPSRGVRIEILPTEWAKQLQLIVKKGAIMTMRV